MGKSVHPPRALVDCRQLGCYSLDIVLKVLETEGLWVGLRPTVVTAKVFRASRLDLNRNDFSINERKMLTLYTACGTEMAEERNLYQL